MIDIENCKQYLFKATAYCDAIIERGEGSFVWDIHGKKYLDLNAGQFCLCFGHNYRQFNELIAEQLEKIHHTNTATITPEFFEAAEAMASINNFSLTKTMFLSTGAEANEAALRYAKFYTKKNGVLSIDKGYHGLTLASQGSTMGGMWALPQVPMTFTVPAPDYIHSDKNIPEVKFLQDCIARLKECVYLHEAEIGAMIIEPVIGVGGMMQIPFEYLKVARKLCTEHNIILIFDECQCGFARSGSWFVYQQAEVVPDILVTSKAMGAGFPVSAITMKNGIAEAVELKLTHFSSHQNDPLSAVVVSFVINEIKKLDLIKSNLSKGKYLLTVIHKLCNECDEFVNPRGIGLMTAFDIDDAKITNSRRFSTLFQKELECNGVLIQAVRQGRTFRIMPNYLITEEEINFFYESCIKAYKTTLKDMKR